MDDKLKVIGICYIVYGALGVLGLPIIYIQKKVMGLVFANVGDIDPEAQAFLDLMDQLMEVLIPAMVLLVIVHIIFNVLVGICFIQRKAYYTCLVTSILTCLFFPLGTILGVFSLMALIDDASKRQFKKLKA